MTKEEFINHIKNVLDSIHNDSTFLNYSKQLLAKKLKAEFVPTLKIDYLWNRILAIITGSCFVLEENKKSHEAVSALYDAAQILENISEISEYNDSFDFDYLRILSALCYDISGYQANAYCLVSSLKEEYKLESKDFDLSEDNFIINQVILILRKEITFANHLLENECFETPTQIFYEIKEALSKWYKYILKLDKGNFLTDFERAYKTSLSAGNVYLSQLLILLKTKIWLYSDRSISNKLSTFIESNDIWRKFTKLLANDNYSINEIKSLEERKSIYEFWISQIRALDNGLLSKDENFVVQMPTSAGKTFIAELFLLKYLTKFPEKKTLYISPFRALSTEKVNELGQHFTKLGYTVSNMPGSYEFDTVFNDLFFDATDVLILTPEKADLIFRTNPEFFNNVSAVVFDEGHIIGELNSRSAIEEFLIIKFKIKFPETKMLFISAVMPEINAKEYAQWLSRNENNVLTSKRSDTDEKQWEPTRKNIGKFEWNGNSGRITFQGGTGFVPNIIKASDFSGYQFISKIAISAALGYELSETGSTLIFCGMVKRTFGVADKILSILELKKNDLPKRFEGSQNESFYYAKLWYGEEHLITKALKYGIGIHYGNMAEAVRYAVENDFRQKKISLLLCTNTVGQGINFPIKNLIIDNLTVNYSDDGTPKNLKHQDFWNLVGRAGRAEKETEGNIIFITRTKADSYIYRDFTHKDNIENSESLIFKFLKLLQNKIIKETEFENILQLITETYLIDLIQEEAIDDSIKNIIDKSLFSVMCSNHMIPLEPIKTGLKHLYSNIKESVTEEEIPVFSKTGLSIKSNRNACTFIQNNIEKIRSAFNIDDNIKVLSLFLDLLSQKAGINEINSDYRFQKLQIANFKDYMDILLCWIESKDIEEIRKVWFENHKDIDFEAFYTLLASGFTYLLPWIYSSFVLLCSFLLNLKETDIPDKIKSTSSFIKYGLNKKLSCLAKVIGIKTRSTALYLEKESRTIKEKDFLSWMANLSLNEINAFKLNQIEKENIKDVVLRMNLKSNKMQPTHFAFKVKGTFYNTDFKENSKKVFEGSALNLLRDSKNKFDPFAILIRVGEAAIGYVTSEYTKFIATEMDLNDTHYLVKATSVKENVQKDYNEIHVEIDKSSF